VLGVNANERRTSAGTPLLAFCLGLAGCSSPTAPPLPPGGGQVLVLNYDQFEQTVEPILVQHGCDAEGDCHGGGIRGSLELSPPTAKNVRFDFDQVVLQVSSSSPATSPILTEPLAAHSGGTPHPVKPFDSTNDPGYQAILAWIQAGELR
jgi:hypothetical protein